jgi:hypothetical protein
LLVGLLVLSDRDRTLVCYADRSRGAAAIDCPPEYGDGSDFHSADIRGDLCRYADVDIIQDVNLADEDIDESILKIDLRAYRTLGDKQRAGDCESSG